MTCIDFRLTIAYLWPLIYRSQRCWSSVLEPLASPLCALRTVYFAQDWWRGGRHQEKRARERETVVLNGLFSSLFFSFTSILPFSAALCQEAKWPCSLYRCIFSSLNCCCPRRRGFVLSAVSTVSFLDALFLTGTWDLLVSQLGFWTFHCFCVCNFSAA